MISENARLYDPLGWIAPAVTTAEFLFNKCGYSVSIGTVNFQIPFLKTSWNFETIWKNLRNFEYLDGFTPKKEDNVFELHGFSDASNVAYATVVYARTIDEKGRVYVHLITSKTRVAPIQQVSIPRLELCGAVLLAKLLNEVADTLQVPKGKLHARTDSSITLAWLSSHPSLWKPSLPTEFRKSSPLRIEINGLMFLQGKSCRSCITRITTVIVCWEFALEPGSWVAASEKNNYGINELKDTNLEERKPKIMIHVTAGNEGDAELLSRFSSLKKLTRVVSFCRRVLRWKKPEKEKYWKY